MKEFAEPLLLGGFICGRSNCLMLCAFYYNGKAGGKTGGKMKNKNSGGVRLIGIISATVVHMYSVFHNSNLQQKFDLSD